MNVRPFYQISGDKVLVTGAKHGLLIDFNTVKIRQLDESVTRTLKLAAGGYTISKAFDALESAVKPSELQSSTDGLSSQHILCRSLEPAVDPQPLREEQGLSNFDFLWIEVTSRCNLKCLHCYAGSEPHRDHGLPGDTLKKIIDEAVELGCKAIQFTGGECLLRDDLLVFVEHALNRGIRLIEVFTNGTLLTESVIQFFSRKGIHVALSLHSYRAAVHDTITGVPGSFEKTLAALKFLLAYDVSTRCATIAMKQNEPDLDNTTYFLSQLGVSSQLPDPVRPSGRGVRPEYWPETYGLRFFQTQPNFSVSSSEFKNNCRRNSCWYGKAAVTSTGNVIPCVFARDQIAGHVLAQTLKEIIEGEKMRSYWSLTYDLVETCTVCEYRYLCRDCRSLVFGLTGNLYAKSPRCTYDPRTGIWGKPDDPALSSCKP